MVARIQIKKLDKSVLYTHDPFNPPSVNPCIYMSLNLSLSHHGDFELQLLDEDLTLDSDIKAGGRVTITLGKESSKMFLRFSGMIRSTGYTRGMGNNTLFNLSGFGSAIRFNERILDVRKDPPVLDSDGVTIDTSNPEFFADEIIDDSVDQKNYYPKDVSSKVEGTGGYGYIDTSSVTGDSPIQDFIAGINGRFVEIEDIHGQVEDYTGGRVYVNQIDKLQFQPIRTPLSANDGYLITTVPDDNHLADNTMYVRSEDYTFTDSIDKASGYSNSIYGILPASPVPDEETNTDFTAFYENKTVEIAQRFKPPTNPNWRIYCTVEGIGLTNVQSENTVRARFRVCKDDNGKPMNTGGVIANKYFYPNEFYSTSDGGIQTVQVMGLGNTDLSENSYYWFILSSVNATSTEYWRWYKDESQRSLTATAAPATSSATDGGTGWTVKESERMGMIQTRFKAEPYNIMDHQAIKNRIIIESVVPSFPQQIFTKLGATKYLLGLMQMQSRPRRIFDFPELTLPNKPPQAGDICIIKDDRFGFSTSGNPIEAGQITDVSYSMGSKGGGVTTSSKGMTSLSLSVVAYPREY